MYAQYQGQKTQEKSAKAAAEYNAQVAENEAAVARAMRAFADEGFRKLMNESGLGNHPDVVRFVVKAGKAITDDRFIVGGNGGAAKKDLAHRMFPNAK